ncbi:uncharacterized protein LOC105638692 isoform X2 [Jatropha curcas]|uniref:uncharacterized protein LOC105638692 isoform X1 n=1 Tax=Jatropha curcas TaxID=180498 RepID=UPI001895CEC0|nr:uncharacterized protein LOC105638692 isoform X1 [Jatropha curcas]XP_037491783.1 uncharacterized protein LOC105638692 isoform X1 [Jatropha curcas]XP_037491784.1 uncharacterized protein LOC105638692 isoform X2 [Jatropha curcas]
METEDMIGLPASSNSRDSSESGEIHKSGFGSGEADSQPRNFEAEEDVGDGDSLRLNDDIDTEKGIRGPDCLALVEDDTGAEKILGDSEVLDSNEDDIGTEEHVTRLENEGISIDDAVTKKKHITESENIRFNIDDAITEEGTSNPNILLLNQEDVRNEEGQFPVETEVDMDLVDSPVMQVNIEVADTVTVSENLSSFGFRVNALQDHRGTLNESLIMMNGGSASGVKRARITYEGQQPSVHVTYNSLTRSSKRKLEEVLQQWSEWHAQHGSMSQELDEVLESGEETYFPALCVGMEKSSTVSFWIENEPKKPRSNGYNPSDGGTVPLYDRGFALGLSSTDGPSNVEGGLEIVGEAARCFNCGSYSHSLKECPKPRNNAAVNNARKQHKSKRNQVAGSRNSIRYYQNLSGGKYEGLKPGALDAETRRLLGIGELDPPPWLNRMRELGYPPGYLDPDDEDQPSGITIFADEDVQEEQEDGEIVETENPDPPRKKAVEFPGINAPIPENADERIWAAGPSGYDPSRNRLHRRSNHSSESISRWNHYEQRGPRDSIDEGPPGVDPVFSPSRSSYPPRYGNHDSSYNLDSPKDSFASLSRSHSDRGKRSPLVYEDSASHSSSPYSSSNKRTSPKDRLENVTDERWNESGSDYLHRSNDEYDRYEHDRHRHRNWR